MKTVSITSGKGGVGKTNVAVNLALALEQLGNRVLILDADLGLANVDLIANLKCDHSIADVVHGVKELRDVLVPLSDGVDVVPASSGVLAMERLSLDARAGIVRQLYHLGTAYDFLIVDTGAGLTENVLFFNGIADRVLVVVTPEPTAMTDSYAMIKVLAAQQGLHCVAVLVNQANSPVEGRQVHERLDEVARRFLGGDIGYAGAIEADASVRAGVRARTPFLLGSPKGQASRSIQAIARRLRDWVDRHGDEHDSMLSVSFRNDPAHKRSA